MTPTGVVAGVGAVERSRNVDVLRAAAALAVLFGHAYLLSGSSIAQGDRQPLHLLVNNGSAGVWLFFALSGYLIGGPFVRALLSGNELPNLRGYAVRRVTRIFPAYLLALTVVFAFGVLPGTHVHWWQYPLMASLLHNLVPGQQQAILFAAWTLTLEMLFYIAMPAVAWAIRRVHPAALTTRQVAVGILSVWAVSIMWTFAVGHVADPTYNVWLRWVFPSMVSMFCPGLLVALAVAIWRSTGEAPRWFKAISTHPWRSLAAVVPFVLIGCYGGTITAPTTYDAARQAFAVASGVVVIVAITRQDAKGTLGAFLGGLGLISYGIYLWQATILQVLFHHGFAGVVPAVHVGTGAYVVHCVYLLALTLPLATLSWIFVERPAIGWARRRTQLAPQKTASADAVVESGPVNAEIAVARS